MENKLVALIGPMGVGKTSIGKQLAKVLKWDWCDTDQHIEAMLGVDIPWIFDIEGEAGFRQHEAHYLQECMTLQNTVLSTGGGIIHDEHNRQLLRKYCYVIYLRLTLDGQLGRFSKLKHQRRPLLQTTDLKSKLEDLAKKRNPLYTACADYTICTDNKSINDVTQALLKQLVNIDIKPVN